MTVCPSPIPAFDTACAARVEAYLDTLTKPPGSLGRLETLALTLAGIRGEDFPAIGPPAAVVFAADHGVAAEGVSAFPAAVTAQMVANFAAGGAAINVFARRIGARLEVVDVGVASDLPEAGVVNEKIRHGTANLRREDAMLRSQAEAAIAVGRRAAERAFAAGCRCLIVGEMGIANTTASSAVLAALTETPPAPLVGAGTGVTDRVLKHKRRVIEEALQARKADPADPLEVLAKLGGLEMAAMAGAYLSAAERRLPLLVDGFIASVAALVACRLDPSLRPFLIFAHRSCEPGHDHVLAALDAIPLLDLGMRLGEGSGAALAYPLLEAAAAMLGQMATFTTAGIEGGQAS